jgi:ATP-binding cassette subfamily B multidrug efflux pump
MFSFFETLVDPYSPYARTDTPPRRLWPYLRDFVRPFRPVFAVTGVFSVLTAFTEVALIWYVGRLVDDLASLGPSQFWAEKGTEVIVVALLILLVRPLIQVTNVALLPQHDHPELFDHDPLAEPCPCAAPAGRLV